MLSSFSPFLHATFSREEDADAIPLDGKVIQVVAPDVDEGRDGGIGLDDLHVYLNPETREQVLLDRESVNEREPESGPPEGKVIDVKLERTGMSCFFFFHTPTHYSMSLFQACETPPRSSIKHLVSAAEARHI